MSRISAKTTLVALVLCLACAALVACSGQAQSSSSAADSGQAASAQASAVDTSSWKTLGDAFEFGGEPTTAGWDDSYYVALFETDDAAIRVVAQSNATVDEKIMNLMPGSENYAKELADAIGDLPLVSAEDITAEKLSQEQLDALVGKTGQELLDEGWTFANYYFYGGVDTGAAMEYGPFSYNVTFDVGVTEEESESDTEGDLIKEAPVTFIECNGAADSAVNPSSIAS